MPLGCLQGGATLQSLASLTSSASFLLDGIFTRELRRDGPSPSPPSPSPPGAAPAAVPRFVPRGAISHPPLLLEFLPRSMIARRAPWRCRPEPDRARLTRVSQPLPAPNRAARNTPPLASRGACVEGEAARDLPEAPSSPGISECAARRTWKTLPMHLADTPGQWGLSGGPRCNKAFSDGSDMALPAPARVEPGGYHGTAQGGYALPLLARPLKTKKCALRTGGGGEGATKNLDARCQKRFRGQRSPPTQKMTLSL